MEFVHINLVKMALKVFGSSTQFRYFCDGGDQKT